MAFLSSFVRSVPWLLWLSVAPVACSSDPKVTLGGDEDVTDQRVETDADPEILADSPLRLNEVACSPDRDAIELHNESDQSVDLSGYVLTDRSEEAARRVRLPEESLPAGGFRLFLPGSEELDFSLDCGAETVRLLDLEGRVADEFVLPDDSGAWGRLPDGIGPWRRTMETPQAPNQALPRPCGALFDPLHPAVVRLELDDDALAALEADPESYVSAGIEIEPFGEPMAGTTGELRLKGGRSFRPIGQKASFVLKLGKAGQDDGISGLDALVLNAMVTDPTAMAETLAYRAYREAGVPAPRTGYARLSLNGEDYGFYVLLERYDESFTGLVFPSTRHLYEGMGDLNAGLEGFEADIGDAADTRDLTRLISRTAVSEETWMEEVTTVLDLRTWARYTAVEQLVGQRDGYTHRANNFYIHFTKQNYATFLPWGADTDFAETLACASGDAHLFTRCLEIDAGRVLYRTQYEEVRALLQTLDFAGWLDELEAVVAPEMATDPKAEFSTEERSAALTTLRQVIAAFSRVCSLDR